MHALNEEALSQGVTADSVTVLCAPSWASVRSVSIRPCVRSLVFDGEGRTVVIMRRMEERGHDGNRPHLLELFTCMLESQQMPEMHRIERSS